MGGVRRRVGHSPRSSSGRISGAPNESQLDVVSRGAPTLPDARDGQRLRCVQIIGPPKWYPTTQGLWEKLLMEEHPIVELTAIVEPIASDASSALRSDGEWSTRMRSFRVRLIRFDRPESKTITLRSSGEAGARAPKRAGRAWRVARIHAGSAVGGSGP